MKPDGLPVTSMPATAGGEAAMSDPRDGLRRALAGLTVRAWRLHLDTGPVRATVPLLRGVWGRALHDRHPDTYRRLFDGGPTSTPRYLLRPADPEVRPAPAVEFVLFGTPDPRDDTAAWDAWEEAGRAGLGPDREPFALTAVRPLAWDGTALGPDRKQPGFGLWPLPWPAGDPAAPCRLLFPAPLRLIRAASLITRPAPADLALAALRRVAALTPGGGTVWGERHAWLEAARAVPAGPWRGGPLDLVRYSARQQADLELHGVAGNLDLPAGPGPLADLLAAAHWFHLGKSTVMGLGRLRTVPLP